MNYFFIALRISFNQKKIVSLQNEKYTVLKKEIKSNFKDYETTILL